MNGEIKQCAQDNWIEIDKIDPIIIIACKCFIFSHAIIIFWWCFAEIYTQHMSGRHQFVLIEPVCVCVLKVLKNYLRMEFNTFLEDVASIEYKIAGYFCVICVH